MPPRHIVDRERVETSTLFELQPSRYSKCQNVLNRVKCLHILIAVIAVEDGLYLESCGILS